MQISHDGWVKIFTDGTVEEGYDYLVNAGLASWSKGRLHGIKSVQLQHGHRLITIDGDGEFLQSDTLEATFPRNEGVIVKRTLYKKIHEDDRWMTISQVFGRVDCKFHKNFTMNAIPVPSQNVGRWFILDLEPSKISWRIADGAVS